MTDWANMGEALDAIDGLGAVGAHEVSVNALKGVAEPIAADMRTGIAKDSGLTAADISVAESKESPDEAVVLIGGTRGKRGRSFIMRFLEFGTVKTRAQPFMRPAWDRARPTYFPDLIGYYRLAYRSIVRRHTKAAA